MIPHTMDSRSTRQDTARYLTEAGHPTAAGTLANLASRGKGPPYELFGRRAIYRWGDALEWARSRVTTPRRWCPTRTETSAAAGEHVAA
jgi:hypothetical protein